MTCQPQNNTFPARPGCPSRLCKSAKPRGMDLLIIRAWHYQLILCKYKPLCKYQWYLEAALCVWFSRKRRLGPSAWNGPEALHANVQTWKIPYPGCKVPLQSGKHLMSKVIITHPACDLYQVEQVTCQAFKPFKFLSWTIIWINSRGHLV